MLPVNLQEARRRLVGMETSDLLRLFTSLLLLLLFIFCFMFLDLRSMPHNALLEGAIVLEEFVKV